MRNFIAVWYTIYCMLRTYVYEEWSVYIFGKHSVAC